MSYKICFCGEIWLIIRKLSLEPLLICSSLQRVGSLSSSPEHMGCPLIRTSSYEDPQCKFNGGTKIHHHRIIVRLLCHYSAVVVKYRIQHSQSIIDKREYLMIIRDNFC